MKFLKEFIQRRSEADSKIIKETPPTPLRNASSCLPFQIFVN